MTTGTSVDYPINLVQRDAFNIPSPYIETNSLVNCKATVGSYFIEASSIYFNPKPKENIKHIQVARKLVALPIDIGSNIIAFEKLDFLADSLSIKGATLNSRFYFNDCTFFKGSQDGFAATGAFKVFLLDCVSAYGNKDGFNYHTTNENSLAVEVNCVSYGNGEYKFLKGNQNKSSNNGSTAHDGMHILRVGSKYSNCEGPVVADINSCYSISVGVNVYDILDSTTGIRAVFYVQNDVGTTTEQEKPKLMIECKQSGAHFDRLIQSTNVNKQYYQNVKGHETIVGNAELFDYETVVKN